ncbi:hypothetical protein [Pseudozobellia sp. WGM2]|nr:hypothetical protein [Pseudozobellia sp. WGM2]
MSLQLVTANMRSNELIFPVMAVKNRFTYRCSGTANGTLAKF